MDFFIPKGSDVTLRVVKDGVTQGTAIIGNPDEYDQVILMCRYKFQDFEILCKIDEMIKSSIESDCFPDNNPDAEWIEIATFRNGKFLPSSCIIGRMISFWLAYYRMQIPANMDIYKMLLPCGKE